MRSERTSSSTVIVLFGPYVGRPSNRRCSIDHTFIKGILPARLVPVVRLCAPIGGDDPPRCLLKMFVSTSNTNRVIRAPQSVIAVSTRSENVFFEPRQVRDVIL